MKVQERHVLMVRKIGLIMIAAYCFGTYMFGPIFAEKHIDLPFLHFPIFLGEILWAITALCAGYVMFKTKDRPSTLWMCLWGGYFVFILVKAYLGYLDWDAFALRNAALFYYSLFALFTYVLYIPVKLTDREFALLALTGMLTMRLWNYHLYYLFSAAFLIMICIINCKQSRMRILLSMLFLMVFPYWEVFGRSRTLMVSSAVTLVFVFTGFAVFMIRNRAVRMIASVAFLLLCVFLVSTTTQPRQWKSLVQIDEIMKQFREMDAEIPKGRHLRRRDRKTIRIYNPNDRSEKLSVVYTESDDKITKVGYRIDNKKIVDEVIDMPQGTINKERSRKHEVIVVPPKKEEFVRAKPIHREGKTDVMSTQVNNILFRVFIWRDMSVEILEDRPIFGFNFGKPFRSVSLETFFWGMDSWLVDGWISAHNSFLHMIYRAGVVGIAVIVLMIFRFMSLTALALKRRSITGLLLMGILLSWIVPANALPILELPYNAIFFWSLFGLTYAHITKKGSSSQYESAPGS